jgi:hypothetical protein
LRGLAFSRKCAVRRSWRPPAQRQHNGKDESGEAAGRHGAQLLTPVPMCAFCIGGLCRDMCVCWRQVGCLRACTHSPPLPDRASAQADTTCCRHYSNHAAGAVHTARVQGWFVIHMHMSVMPQAAAGTTHRVGSAPAGGCRAAACCCVGRAGLLAGGADAAC